MAATFDLHSHSTASDGSLDPAQLVRRAARLGVQVLALTDHDTTAGLAAARAEAQLLGIGLVPGVEVSVTWRGITIHVLGLGVDESSRELQELLERLRDFRGWRAAEIGRRLAAHGISGALAGAQRFAGASSVGRGHFARYLVQAGYASDIRGVFKRFLTHGRPGHVAGQWATLDEAVSGIRRAGGTAVVAHPARYPLTRSKLCRLLGEFRECGGRGLEVVSGCHNRDDCYSMARHAQSYGLLATVGSDYHGASTPWLELGRLSPLPEQCRALWSGWVFPTLHATSPSAGDP